MYTFDASPMPTRGWQAESGDGAESGAGSWMTRSVNRATVVETPTATRARDPGCAAAKTSSRAQIGPHGREAAVMHSPQRVTATVLGAGSAMTRIRWPAERSHTVTIASGSRSHWSNRLARVRALRPGKMRSRKLGCRRFCAGVRAGMRAMDRGTAPAEKSTVMTPSGRTRRSRCVKLGWAACSSFRRTSGSSRTSSGRIPRPLQVHVA